MKFVIAMVIIIGLSIGGYQLYEYWGNFKDKEAAPAAAPAPPEVTGQELAGMPPSLQPALEAAQSRGASGLHDFLNTYGNTISDPRKAWIELDYAVLVAQSNPGEARRVFAKVKNRTPPDSPVYSRVQQLEKTYD